MFMATNQEGRGKGGGGGGSALFSACPMGWIGLVMGVVYNISSLQIEILDKCCHA